MSSRIRKSAVAATSVAAGAALVAGVALVPAGIESAQPEPTVYANPTLVNSTSIGGGLAIDPEGVITDLLGKPAWKLIADELGATTAVAVLPGAAIAFAAKNESATAFALGGLAVATTDFKVPLFPKPVPLGQVSCIGVLAFAHSSTEGACLNVLGTFDADYRKDAGEVSFALTNPIALAGILSGDMKVGELIKELLDGQPLSRLLTEDLSRITFGGSNIVSLTSEYALQQYAKSGGAVVIGWLGGELVLFPVIDSGLLEEQVNYLGLPQFNVDGFGKLTSISDIIPSLSVGAFKTPIPGVDVPAWSTEGLLDSVGTSADTKVLAGTVADEPTITEIEEAPADTTAAEQTPAETLPAETPAAPSVDTPATPEAEAPAADSSTLEFDAAS
ncbi:hypothetical protein ACFQNE_13975 [Gordonia phosphorivorans]|uniref:PE-PPE domain-containing protein n=1 Tax=Gordonia phosphorivorans TaxID=1056982 RepID=A0ABV6HB48_9ACTN